MDDSKFCNDPGQRPGRNTFCPCGSGLKHKKCHGSEALRQRCQQFAGLYFMHLITPIRLRAGIIDQETHDQMLSRIDTALVEAVIGKDDNSDVVESEDHRREVREMQKIVGLVRCPKCGRCVPAGTKCVKCGVIAE